MRGTRKRADVSPKMLEDLRRIEEYGRVTGTNPDGGTEVGGTGYHVATIVALRERGLIRVEKVGEQKSERSRGHGQYRFVSTTWNVPVIKAWVTPAGLAVLAAHAAPRKGNGRPSGPELDIDTNGHAAALRVALEDAAGDFTVVMVEAPVGEVQEAVLERLASWSGRGDVPTLALVDVSPARSSRDPLVIVDDAVREAMAGGAGGVVLYGVDPHFPADPRRPHSPAIHWLNGYRDGLADIIRGPLVIVADGHSLARMAKGMPDFFSWRAFATSARRVA